MPLWKHGNFYLHVTVYIAKKKKYIPEKSTGIVFGIKHQLTFSTGKAINYTIKMPANLRRLYQSLAWKVPGSKNYVKNMTKI